MLCLSWAFNVRSDGGVRWLEAQDYNEPHEPGTAGPRHGPVRNADGTFYPDSLSIQGDEPWLTHGDYWSFREVFRDLYPLH